MASDSTANPPDATGDRLLIIELRGGLYGIESTTVREIVAVLDATRLPGAPPHVRGVVNLRGLLITVVDLAQRLTGAPTVGGEGSIVVTSANERTIGILVDDVHDVQDIAVVPVEREILARADGLLTGVGRLDDEVVLVIDIPELIRQTLA